MNFNLILSKYIVHPLVEIKKKTLIIFDVSLPTTNCMVLHTRKQNFVLTTLGTSNPTYSYLISVRHLPLLDEAKSLKLKVLT